MSDVTKLITPKSSGDYEELPAGIYLARCFKMVDLGTQETSYLGVAKLKRQIMLYWEILEDEVGAEVKMENTQPFAVSKMYTWSMNKKANLRSDLDAWRGKPFSEEEADSFEITSLLDKFCTIQVVHKEANDRTYVNVDRVMSTKKTAKGVNELSSFSIDQPDMKLFEAFPDWLKDKINKSQEFSGGESNITDEDLANFDGVTSDELEKPNF